MSRQRNQLSIVIRRVAIGLLALATPVLLAPQASATPDSDANDAISAAWDATGGDTGPLGPRDGGVYPVGDGFGQNFAGGKMFFTPATGAHLMQGAILEKYESLGGPADGDLGFPTIDEGSGRMPDSRNNTFSAADKPVIFWTPATGAHVVRGAINAAWDKLGGSAGALGAPAEDEVYRGDVVSQKFTGGEVSWNRKTEAFTTVPPELAGQLAGLQVSEDATTAIDAARRAAGGALGPLGAKGGPQYQIGDDGAGQDFAGGKIFYSPATGANVVTGQVLAKYESVGGPEGDLGFPTSSEVDGGLGTTSRMSTFAAKDQPVIFWTPDYGAVIVRGAMNAAWQKLDGAKGELGAPTADQTENGDVISQRFSGGAISWDKATSKFSTEPASLASSLAGLQVPGQEVPKAPASPSASSDSDDGKWFVWRWNWWWLLAVIPVLVLAGLVVGAVMWSQRRGRGDARLEDSGVPVPAGQRASVDGGEAETPFTERMGEASAAPLYGATGAVPGQWEAAHEEADAGAFGLDDNADDIDTAPTRVEAPADVEPGPDTVDAEEAADIVDAEILDTEVVDTEAADAEEAPDTAGDEAVDSVGEEATVSAGEEVVDGVDEVAADDEDETAEDEPAGDDTVEGGAMIEDDDADLAPADDRAPQAGGIPFVDNAPSRRHAAVQVDEPVLERPSLHLPLDDPDEAPEGYPVKANVAAGRYWLPDSPRYDEVEADIWFVSEDFASGNGFIKADQT